MSIYFLDSSALAKRYVTEAGSGWIKELCDPVARNPIIIARITWVEVLSALARRQREGSLAQADVRDAIQALRYDIGMQYQIAELDRSLAEVAGTLVVRHPLRAYDAVQLASALRAQSDLGVIGGPPVVFCAADDRLIDAAKAEGLQIDNPNHHP